MTKVSQNGCLRIPYSKLMLYEFATYNKTKQQSRVLPTATWRQYKLRDLVSADGSTNALWRRFHWFLADRTARSWSVIGMTVLSVCPYVRLSVMLCIVAKQYIQQQKWLESALLQEHDGIQLSTPAPTLRPYTPNFLHYRLWCHPANKLKCTQISVTYLRDFTLKPLLLHLLNDFAVRSAFSATVAAILVFFIF